MLADKIYEVLCEYSSVGSILAILLDNTSVNTGFKTGVVVSLERLLNRPLFTIGCSHNQNELPFCHVFKHLDGSTKLPRAFTGPIVRLAEKNP